MSENEEVTTPSTHVAEVKEETPVVVEEPAAAPTAEGAEPIYTDPNPTPVEKIDRFWWSGGLHS
jgi:hypothetical protein